MKTIESLVNTEKKRSGIIIGAGATIKEYRKQIDAFSSFIPKFLSDFRNHS